MRKIYILLAASVLANGLASKSLVMADGDNANAVQMQAEILVSKGKAQAPEIAKILFNDMDGWGTCDSFGNNFSRITKYNVINVLKAYKKEHSNGLLHDIAREYEVGGLDLNERVSYIKKIKNFVMDFIKGQNPDADLNEVSTNFDKELQEQSETYGRMDVSKLDGILNSAILKYSNENKAASANVSAENLLKGFNNIKNDYDVAEWISKINNNNASELINSARTGRNNCANTFIENVLKSDKISNDVKTTIIEKLISNLSDSDTKVNVITNFLYIGLDENINFDYEKFIKQMDSNEFRECKYNFGNISTEKGKQNYAASDSNMHNGTYFSKAARYYCAMCLPQAVVNADNLSKQQRKNLLHTMIDKASEYKNNSLTSEQKERYKKDAKKFVNECKFNSKSNADMVNILISELMDLKGFGKYRDPILERYNYEL